MHADFGVSSDTLVQLASGLNKQCVKKQCGLAGSCFGGRLDLDLFWVQKGVKSSKDKKNIHQIHIGLPAVHTPCIHPHFQRALLRS